MQRETLECHISYVPTAYSVHYRIHDDLLRLYLLSPGTDPEISQFLDDSVSAAFSSIRQSENGRYYTQSTSNNAMNAASCSLGLNNLTK